MQILACAECEHEFDADEEIEVGEFSMDELQCPACGADNDALTGL